ncbi:MAG: hypothetical protein DRP71_02935 [Verrucomicrobia bacterium]|nr:MAG: hypothetical protein DRP71_02935 [Verrucomicrobiota bacterium]
MFAGRARKLKPMSWRGRLFLAHVLTAVCVFGRLEAEPDEIVVRTESLEVRIHERGGVPVSWRIIDPAYLGPKETVVGDQGGVELIGAPVDGFPTGNLLDLLLPTDFEEEALMRSAVYSVERSDDAGGTRLRLLAPVSAKGVRLIRTYRFPERGFTVGFSLTWENTGDGTVTVSRDENGFLLALGPGLGGRSRRDAGLAGALYAYVAPLAATGSVIDRPELDLDRPRLDLGGEDGPLRWVGLHNRYFLMALAPSDESPSPSLRGAAWIEPDGISGDDFGPTSRVGIATGPVVLNPGETVIREFTLFAGPKIRSELRTMGEDLDQVLYLRLWNWLRWLSFGLLALMNGIHALVPSWGLTIILLAVVIRLILSPVAQKGIRAQSRFNAANAKMRPHLKRINDEFAKDPARRHRETMKVYKEHGVSMYSPFKGCLTLFLQIPIFIALFNVIGQAYELRGVGFLWIGDLAAPDRLFPLGVTLPVLGDSFNLLPVLMALTQVFSTKLAPPDGSDARQQRTQKWSMWAMALGFFLLFYNFPAGLIIYWTCANLGHLVQQRLWKANPALSETQGGPSGQTP